MRYFFTRTGLVPFDEGDKRLLFQSLNIPYIQVSASTLNAFDTMVDSPFFLFKHEDVKDEELYPFHNKTLGSHMYFSDVAEHVKLANHVILVRGTFYTESEGFVINIFRITPALVDAWLRQYYIDQFLADNT